jgi:hypothetical protein
MPSVQELEEQARMLRGALTALAAREEALRTARTLDDDLGRLRARAESMQASGHPKAVRLLCTNCDQPCLALCKAVSGTLSVWEECIPGTVFHVLMY